MKRLKTLVLVILITIFALFIIGCEEETTSLEGASTEALIFELKCRESDDSLLYDLELDPETMQTYLFDTYYYNENHDAIWQLLQNYKWEHLDGIVEFVEGLEDEGVITKVEWNEEDYSVYPEKYN